MHYEQFKITDPAVLRALIEGFPFATITVSNPNGPPAMAHAPVTFRDDLGPNGGVAFHLANANPVLELMKDGVPLSIAIHGPNCPISPSWYKARFPGENPDRSQTAPTHDYVNAVLHGRLEKVNDVGLAWQIQRLVTHTEPAGGWKLSEMDPTLFKNLRGMITAFRMPIDSFDLTAKVSQEQNIADRPGIIAGLRERGSFQDVAMAQLIERFDPAKPSTLIDGLQSVSPNVDIVRHNPRSLFKRLAASLELLRNCLQSAPNYSLSNFMTRNNSTFPRVTITNPTGSMNLISSAMLSVVYVAVALPRRITGHSAGFWDRIFFHPSDLMT